MQTASFELPRLGKSIHRTPLFSKDTDDSTALAPPREQELRLRRPELDVLPELLQLVGQGIGSRSAYLIVPPRRRRAGGVRDNGWSRVEWHIDGNRTIFEWDYVLPEDLCRPQIFQNGRRADARASIMFFDDRSEAVVPVFGPHTRLLGFLGIAYPDGVRPHPVRIQLLQDIVANQLHGISALRPKSRHDLQHHIDGKTFPVLIVTDGQISCLNQSAESMLCGESAEVLAGHSLDEFVSTSECDVVNRHLAAVVGGAKERRFECTLVGYDGHERRVEMQCRRHVWRDSVSVEIMIRELARYRTYPDPLIDTLSEAVWHIRLDSPVPCSAPIATQSHLIRRHGALSEANRSFAAILRADSLEHLLGRRLSRLLSVDLRELISAFVKSNYNIRGYELFLRDAEGGVRLFLVNATGTVENGRLTDIWGSCSEVSDRIELERKSVSMQEEQKERIGRDLHDSVAPLLTGMRLLSGDIIDSHSMEADSLKGKIEKIANFAEQATDRLGEIYRGLVPRVLEQKSLAEALDLLVGNLDDLPGVNVRFVRSGEADVVQKEDKIQLYRIVQEAVNNAIKHAAAGSIVVSLERQDGRVVLQIQDDGKGFDVRTRKAESLGLQNMRLRANSIGGTLSLTSEQGSGTRISVSLAMGAPRSR